jgi:nitrate reductase NapAB chaperone NapD
MKAIVLVKFTSLETKDSYHHLRDLEAVIDSYMVYGRYDAVAIIQAANLEEIRNIILSQIQAIPGVIETMPCLLVEPVEAPIFASLRPDISGDETLTGNGLGRSPQSLAVKNNAPEKNAG